MKSVLFGVPGLGLASMAGVCVTVFMMLTTPSSAEDRTLSIYNIHTQETVSITYKRNGSFVPEALQQLNHFMRDWRENLERKIDPNLFDIIWELHQELGSKEPVHLVCGYRSAKTNEMLRRTSGGQAKNSLHLVGQAADIIFPDVPLKQLRYAALAKERGGVGYYPTSGLPFVHVDTGSVRHWGPALTRTELALIFPNGHSRHIPSDGRPLTPADSRIALAKWQAAGNELPWIVSHRKASGTMLASLTPEKRGSDNPLFQRASLTMPEKDVSPKALESVRLPKVTDSSATSPIARSELSALKIRELIWEADDEPEDEAEQEVIPTEVLLAEQPVTYTELPDAQSGSAVSQKIAMLMSPPTVLASEQFEHGLQIEGLYEAHHFRGAAVAFNRQRRMTQVASAEARAVQAMLLRR